ncbi:hypothetical protein SAMN05421734_11434 [Pelagirhabdus alkalitolerans]|uniref:Rhodanese-related sulfurtransferase n=1 Tax=Pelagirhabdus alkalitolerans TaxID=1612202 RepID=A0A1G6N5M9_9BACI|nr:hypothetical protein [Pelagirhabdus alkalitolerans]SDC63168.1 hypothetical protein SAMN05421734_11434 [Pelagirhabdus alkalitolerans]
MWVASLIFVALVSYVIYTRYVPVRGVRCISKDKLDESLTIVDLRDYNDSAKEAIVGSVALPIAYIKRHHHGISNQSVYVIASDCVEKNIGIRLLMRYGHQVSGYTIINDDVCQCKNWLTKMA